MPANLDAFTDYLNSKEEQKTKPKAKVKTVEHSESQLNMVTQKWEDLPLKEENSDVQVNVATKIAFAPHPIAFEVKKNRQYTLTDSQQLFFQQAAQERNYIRRGRGGELVANPSKFLQDLIDYRVWEAYEFLVQQDMIQDYQQWQNNKGEE
ncbi:MAG: hypothetical protein FWE43_02930 [Streptococcaceae bacterium]|nr:hypothetical protein [Streptococcaceae bacterium]MCL2681417.1 hypothetical protein [Streptococcaceae bacterium]